METLFKKPAYEITDLEMRTKMSLDSFYTKFAGKKGEKLEELRKTNPEIAYYLDRLAVYREVDDLKNGRFQNLIPARTTASTPLNNPAREAEAQKVLSGVTGGLKEKAEKLKQAGFNEKERRLILNSLPASPSGK